jgi:hypothetical protein
MREVTVRRARWGRLLLVPRVVAPFSSRGIRGQARRSREARKERLHESLREILSNVTGAADAPGRLPVRMDRTLLAAVAIMGWLGTAHAVVLCARPRANGTFNTTVKLRETCAKGETQLDPGALGLQGPTGAPGPKGPPGNGFTMNDANGAEVGTVVELGPNPSLIARDLAGSLVQLYVSYNNIDPHFQDWVTDIGSAVGLLYEGTDCTGSPWFQTPVFPPGLIGIAQVHNGLAYYGAGPAMNVTIGSEAFIGQTASVCASRTPPHTFIPPETCCVTYAPPDEMSVVAALSFDLTTLGLVPPFHVVGP